MQVGTDKNYSLPVGLCTPSLLAEAHGKPMWYGLAPLVQPESLGLAIQTVLQARKHRRHACAKIRQFDTCCQCRWPPNQCQASCHDVVARQITHAKHRSQDSCVPPPRQSRLLPQKVLENLCQLSQVESHVKYPTRPTSGICRPR